MCLMLDQVLVLKKSCHTMLDCRISPRLEQFTTIMHHCLTSFTYKHSNQNDKVPFASADAQVMMTRLASRVLAVIGQSSRRQIDVTERATSCTLVLLC